MHHNRSSFLVDGDNKKQVLSDRELLTGLFFRLLPYQILLIVINAINGIVDTLYASNVLGKSAMIAIGLYAPITHFLYAASIMLVGGSQILYGRYIAVKRESVNSVFTIDIILSVILSIVTSLIMIITAVTGATRIVVDTEPDLSMFNLYLIGQSIGIPALVLGQQLFAFLSLENQSKRTMIASISCFVMNAILNHLFVVILPIGIFGLALSTSLSYWTFLLIQAQYYFAGKSEWRFDFKICNWQDGKDIARLGVPGAISRLVETLRCVIVNYLIIAYVGTVGISSFAASNSVMAIFWPVVFGMMAVSRMLYSISVGEKDRRSLIDTMYISTVKGMLVIFAVIAFIVLFAKPLTFLFYQDPQDPVFGMTVMGLRLLPFCMILSLVCTQFTCYAQTIERKNLAVVLPTTDGMIGVVCWSLILIPLFKMNGLYIANILNGVICTAIIVIAACICLKRFPRNLEDLMAIPEDFGAGDSDRLDITVHDMDEVVSISEKIVDFCKDHGIDQRRSFLAGLSMEEMAGNVVAHGFTKDNKKHSIDLRVVCDDKEIILRCRDNCRAFNPSDRYKVNEQDEVGKNVGIRLVYKIAKEVSYQNLLGLNVLTIKI
ncbi:MATE family efflux transporter [Butyrivibrio sp. LC3010]|uniref:MATE family efflux transporter n=1 Tax=Butyrivibrio sp. LC3010 TaxID=1280680 RepID=UPI00047B2ACE|nr:MATE family efflux transporter [Butyrivibrio sp. LC3010]